MGGRGGIEQKEFILIPGWFTAETPKITLPSHLFLYVVTMHSNQHFFCLIFLPIRDVQCKRNTFSLLKLRVYSKNRTQSFIYSGQKLPAIIRFQKDDKIRLAYANQPFTFNHNNNDILCEATSSLNANSNRKQA